MLYLDKQICLLGSGREWNGRHDSSALRTEHFFRKKFVLNGKHFPRNFHHGSVEVVGKLFDVECGGSDDQLQVWSLAKSLFEET